MFVCRAWYDILDQRSLLYSLDINVAQFDKTKSMLESFSHRRPQVEYLTLYLPLSHDFDKRIFFNLFPNLRHVVQKPLYYETTTSNYFDLPFRFTNTTSKLNKLTDFGQCQLTRQLAMSNSFGRLNSLELDFFSLSLNIVPQLKNMPVLQHTELICIRTKI
jgi:hypothetical protein